MAHEAEGVARQLRAGPEAQRWRAQAIRWRDLAAQSEAEAAAAPAYPPPETP